MADITTTLTLNNYEEYASSLVKLLTGRVFNILIPPKGLKFCGRRLTGNVLIKNGQVSIELNPGGSIAWDLNVEKVSLNFRENGDVLLVRIFGLEKRKVILITQNPI